MDPPVLSKKIRWFLAITQFFGISKYFMPLAKKSSNRSDKFPSKAFLHSKLRNKFLFKNFSDTSFNNYIEHGFTKGENEVHLRFKKKVETKIFALTPPFYSKIKLSLPSYFLYATNGDIADTRPINEVKPIFPNSQFIEFPGGHLFPLEQTEKCSQVLLKILSDTKTN